ncbi:MAG: helix-turn-helix-type transcriptional regulator, partial [Myxococcales bacterium]|nr:helix-turn-helix-type transcriptional regulator [Myxococcales bacterium]
MTAKPDQHQFCGWLSIGTLARSVGIPVETIRTWERRYGAPVPRRLVSGHRRYDPAEIERLQEVRD